MSNLILSEKARREQLRAERQQAKEMRLLARTVFQAKRQNLLHHPTHDGTMTIDMASGLSGKNPAVEFRLLAIEHADGVTDYTGYDANTKSLITVRIANIKVLADHETATDQ